MTVQVNWRRWQWPWHTSSKEIVGLDAGAFSHFAGIGPFQFHWWASK